MALLSIAGRDDVAPMRDFLDRHDLAGAFPHVVDEDGELWARFGVAGQPTWVFVDDSGESERTFGALSDDELRAELDDLEAS